MTYVYLYQTKDNENRRGEIKAASRAEAYAALRKQKIRPYRLIGDDPTFWTRWRWWLCGGGAALLAVAALAAVLVFRATSRAPYLPMKRQQLSGDKQVIAKGVAEGWQGVFSNPLDSLLAAYAQPGWKLEPDEGLDIAGLDAFVAALDDPIVHSDEEGEEVRQLKNIVAQMRIELKEYLANGGTVADYMEFLEERQQRECDLRDKARETLERAPEAMRRRAWLNLNIRLGDMGIAPLPDSGF